MMPDKKQMLKIIFFSALPWSLAVLGTVVTMVLIIHGNIKSSQNKATTPTTDAASTTPVPDGFVRLIQVCVDGHIYYYSDTEHGRVLAPKLDDLGRSIICKSPSPEKEDTSAAKPAQP